MSLVKIHVCPSDVTVNSEHLFIPTLFDRFPHKPSIRQEGENLVMECQLEANPLPEITWFRGEKRVEETNR